MDLETISPADFGKSLTGMEINVLVRDVRRQAEFLTAVFGASAHRLSDDFAIMRYAGQTFQLHRDGTYQSHPLLGLLPEAGPRGAGAQFHMFETDPDEAVAKAAAFERATILQAPTEKPHGLREAFILCENGYAWVASRRLS